ncbi:unnamed protein product [marine sediment metagenome]|uniref:Uncharacterized protein n=1 Tax=marine sediment metagenome TaxID=412755 RepID=X0WAN4_9ZZZZ
MSETTERDLVIQLKNALAAKREASKALKNIEEEYNKAESALIELLESRNAKASAKYEGVGSFTLVKPRLHANSKIEDSDRLFQFLRESNREDLIKTRVSPASLSSFVSELVEEGKKIPEEFISIHYTTRLLFVSPK